MDQWACVDIPALPLQLLLRSQRDWEAAPAAVVAEDKPQGAILWVNAHARRLGILPGFRYAAALAIAGNLRAREIAPATVQECIAETTRRLRDFTPGVEPSTEEPGVFWLNAKGLLRIFSSLEAWAEAIRARLALDGLEAAVAVGFTRFGTYVAAKVLAAKPFDSRLANVRYKPVVLGDRQIENTAMRRTPLSLLGLPPPTRDALLQLGVETLGEFLALPSVGLMRRYGPEAYRLHRMASGNREEPFHPQDEESPLKNHLDFGYAESDIAKLTFFMKQLLDPLLAVLSRRGEVLSEITLSMGLERNGERVETIRPAEPTLDGVQILNLLRLRLESKAPSWPPPVKGEVGKGPGAVEWVTLTVRHVTAANEQLGLFAQKNRRDLGAAARAFARLRSLFGDGAVVHAKLQEKHLPEAGFTWEPMAEMPKAQPRTALPALIRRMSTHPVALAPKPLQESEDWLPCGSEGGSVVHLTGPYKISGAWWRSQIDREYYFAEMTGGEILWIYYDRPRQIWFWQGEVA